MTLYGALRLGEVIGLQWGDVDFDTGYITIERQVGLDGRTGTPKGGRTDRIPMMPQMRALLAEMKMRAKPENSKPDSPVFVNSLGGHRQSRDVQATFDKARRYAALSDEPRAFRFHDLRHTSVSMLANRPGADMVQVQAFARHANLQTTLGYVHKIEKPEWADEMGDAFAAFGS